MTTPNNLPAELSSFVGRERQLAELRRLLSKSRLITLTGPGGAGKTRVALRLAASMLDRHPDGVWLVDLAPLNDSRLLEQTVAVACRIKETQHRPLIESLMEGLGERQTLLVLDGCEHLVESCAGLASRLLRSCRALTVLATSREPLGVPGEVIWRTPSLTVPKLEDAAHLELLLESEAIRLFVERARLSRPDFEFEQSSSSALAQICMRLEGIPLAIELASSLAGVMTMQEILERLSDRFRLLTGGSRSALPRHQTLRQAVDWSYGLLRAPEQALLERLALFAGGFDLSAAEAVAQGGLVNPEEVLQLVSSLVNKSLLTAEPARSQMTRYRMLDTIREYALEKLMESGESDGRRRHADYFLVWCSMATNELISHEQLHWLRRLDEEQANIRLALDWSLSEQPDSALRLAAAMGSYWFKRGHLSEGLEWLGRALAVETSSPEFRVDGLLARARIRRRRGDFTAARRDADECMTICRELGLDRQLALALTMLGIVSSHADDLTSAAGFFDEAMQLALQLGDRGRVAISLNNLAMVDSAQGRQEAARARIEEGVTIANTTDDRFLKAALLDTDGRINYRLGNHDAARRSYAEGLTLSAQLEDTINGADTLEGMALLALHDGDMVRVVVLMSAAHALRSATGAQGTKEWTAEVVEAMTTARAKLSRQAADAALQQGAALGLQEAVRYALGSSPVAAPTNGSPLTGRERQVATLIADGLTNPEIAKHLHMAGRTADAHVEHIRNKLGLRTRAQIAVWAHERLGIAPS